MQAHAPRFMFSLPVVHMVEVKEGPLRACPFDEDIKANEATEESGEGFGGREQTVQHGGLSGEWSPTVTATLQRLNPCQVARTDRVVISGRRSRDGNSQQRPRLP